ncbi:MAG: tyrosine--tRNA ligase [Candidatus Kerfeldbacteria bacterium]|nr:tyrosine--tRNA ligase [Candidatus Kerfeldbacteria bacterium]
MQTAERINELLNRGVAEVIDRPHLQERLRLGKQLRLKYGIDPTGQQIHIGHAVPLRALRRFQDLGHTAILLIGDFTARIGDPSGRDITRPQLTAAQVKQNARTYTQQAFKILDKKRTEVRWNSEWLQKMKLPDVLAEAARISASWVYSHDTFRQRLQSGRALGFHELFYPMLQAYDSVALKADVEFGALDQKFNLLTGRELMKAHGLAPQDVVLTRYLIGTDGQKMGKSLNNFIALEEEPFEMFGKVMSMPDTVLRDYFELATDVPVADFDKMKWSGAEARNTKMFLARKIVEEYHGVPKSNAAMRKWEDFSKGSVDAGRVRLQDIPNSDLVGLLVVSKQAKSKSEAQRIIQQGGVKLNGLQAMNWKEKLSSGDAVTVGKKNRTFTIV